MTSQGVGRSRERPVFRFAPSPNGPMHVGHALSALINFEAAKQTGGRFLLRIEDTDLYRCRPEHVQAIFEDLHWLGLTWEEPVRRQSENLTDYDAALRGLDDLGLLYRATMSRSRIATHVKTFGASGRPWPRDPDGTPLYPALDRPEQPVPAFAPWTGLRDFALRLNSDRAAEMLASDLSWTEIGPSGPGHCRARPGAWGDVLLAGRDRPAAYHIAVVVDDALQGITHVVRGLDVRPSTSIHRVLQQLLGLPAPVYVHHRLILDDAGNKLSKSGGGDSLRQLRKEGHTPQDIRDLIGFSKDDIPRLAD